MLGAGQLVMRGWRRANAANSFRARQNGCAIRSTTRRSAIAAGILWGQ